MKTQLNIDLINDSNLDKPENAIEISFPQTTKNSGHSKIKGFSFQIETGSSLKDSLNQLNKNQELNGEPTKTSFTKIQETTTPSKLRQTHKTTTSYHYPNFSSIIKNENDKTDLNIIEEELMSQKKHQPITNGKEELCIMEMIRLKNFVPISRNVAKINFEKYEATKHSSKSINQIKSFAVNTHQGVVRKYNEDRVSIVLNIVRPKSFKGAYWPVSSFFGVFDGHGGSKCADFLKDNLHNYVSLIL